MNANRHHVTFHVRISSSDPALSFFVNFNLLRTKTLIFLNTSGLEYSIGTCKPRDAVTYTTRRSLQYSALQISRLACVPTVKHQATCFSLYICLNTATDIQSPNIPKTVTNMDFSINVVHQMATYGGLLTNRIFSRNTHSIIVLREIYHTQQTHADVGSETNHWLY